MRWFANRCCALKMMYIVSIYMRQYELLTCYYIDSVHVVSSSSEWAAWSSGWKPDSKHEGPKFNSRLRKNTRVAQRKCAVKTSSVTHLDFHQVRTTDGYRLISRRSLDRNQPWVFYTSVALKKRPVKLDAKRSYRNSSSTHCQQFGGFAEATSLLRQTLNTVM